MDEYQYKIKSNSVVHETLDLFEYDTARREFRWWSAEVDGRARRVKCIIGALIRILDSISDHLSIGHGSETYNIVL